MKTTIINEKWDSGETYSILPRFMEMDKPELPNVGTTYLVYEIDNGDHTVKWTDDELMVNEGFPGNSDHSIRRFHGWRGTTDNCSVHAMGVRRCLSVIRKEFRKTVRYHIKFGQDMKRDEK